MQDHPKKETLVAYILKALSPTETTQTILHIDECAMCSSFVRDHPLTLQPEEILNNGQAIEVEFHLDQDEHVFPYVEKRADLATTKLVHDHVSICEECAFLLSELENQTAETNTVGVAGRTTSVWQRSYKSPFVTVLVCSTAVLLCLAIAWHFFVDERSTSIVDANVPGVVAPLANTDTNATTSPKQVADTDDADVPVENEPDDSDKQDDLARVSDLPVGIRREVITALRTGRLTKPDVLKTLSRDVVLRSGGTDGTIASGTPDGIVVSSTSPVLSWKGSENTVNYSVKIFDEKFNIIVDAEKINDSTFKTNTALKRGEIYWWEVTDGSKSVAVGKFKVLSAPDNRTLRTISSSNPLKKALAMYYFGLRSEARREFEKAVANDKSGTAKKFLSQLK